MKNTNITCFFASSIVISMTKVTKLLGHNDMKGLFLFIFVLGSP